MEEPLLADYGPMLTLPANGAKTWTRLDRRTSGSYPVDGTYHLVHREGGQWLVWNGFRLYQAADPAGPWRCMPAPVDTCLDYRGEPGSAQGSGSTVLPDQPALRR